MEGSELLELIWMVGFKNLHAFQFHLTVLSKKNNMSLQNIWYKRLSLNFKAYFAIGWTN